MYAGALYTVERGHDLVERIAQLSKELVPRVEVDRARNMLADLEQRAVDGPPGVAGAQRRPDPGAAARPPRGGRAAGARSLQVTLIDPARPLDDLMPIALTNRPELASRRALVQAAESAIRREKARPLLPHRPAQRLPDARHVHPGRDLRHSAPTAASTSDGPCRREHSAHLAARRLWDREPRADQGAAR